MSDQLFPREKRMLKSLADSDMLICRNCGHGDNCHGDGGCNGVVLDPPIPFCGCEDFIADLRFMGGANA